MTTIFHKNNRLPSSQHLLQTVPRIVSFASLTLLILQLPSYGITKDDDIDTNRPSFMASPLVVPQASVQFENGGLYQHFQHDVNYYDASETEVRVGLSKTTELQAFVPQWVLLDSPSAALAGASSITDLGLKQQLRTPFKKLSMSVLAGITPPTGRRLISSYGVGASFRAPYMYQISKNWSVGGMQSLVLLNGGHEPEFESFNMLYRSLGSRAGIFVEYGGFFTHHLAPQDIIHIGAVKKLNKNMQIDVQTGYGLNKTAPAAFVGLGYSFRFDKLPHI